MASVELLLYKSVNPIMTYGKDGWTPNSPNIAYGWIYQDSVNITDYVIENSLEADFIFEYTKIFDFISGSATFQCASQANIRGMLNLGFNQDGATMILVRIGSDFLGYIDVANSSYDPNTNVYTINCVDIFKFFHDLQENNKFYALDDISLNGFLNQYIKIYSSFSNTAGQPYSFRLGSPAPIVASINTVIDNDGSFATQHWIWCSGNITYNDLLLEMQKYYNAIIYVDGNGTLNFISKNYTPDKTFVDISSSIYEDGQELDYALYSQYNALIVNVPFGLDYFGHGAIAGQKGWGLIYTEDKKPVVYSLLSDLELQALTGTSGQLIGSAAGVASASDAYIIKIPSYYKYLDLRQKLPHLDSNGSMVTDYDFISTYLFPDRVVEHSLAIYQDILTSPLIQKRKVYGVGLKPYQHVSIGGGEYVITRIKKHYHQNYSELELRVMDDSVTFPNPFN